MTVRMACLVALALLLPIDAQSQPASPTPPTVHTPQAQGTPDSSKADGNHNNAKAAEAGAKNGSVDSATDPRESRQKEDHGSSPKGWTSDPVMSFLTLVMALFTGAMWWVARMQVQMTHRIERAYVAMS